MKRDFFHLGLAAASLLVLVVAVRQGQQSPEAAVPPAPSIAVAVPLTLRAIPKDAPLLLTIDLEAPGAAALRSLLFSPERELAGVGRLRDVCGYDPSAGIQALTIAALKPTPGESLSPAFAIVAAGDFDQPKLASCVERVLHVQGGRAERHRSGSMTLIRNPASEAEIALLDEGLVVVSSRDQLRQLLQALDGHVPNVSTDATHRALREALGERAAVLGTLAFQSGWLRQLLEDEDVERSPLARLKSAALRLDLTDGVLLEALFRCEHPADVEPLQVFLRDLRRELEPLLREQGLAELDRFELVPQGQDLRVRWKLDRRTLAQLVQRLSQPLPVPPPRALPATPRKEPVLPEETIPAPSAP